VQKIFQSVKPFRYGSQRDRQMDGRMDGQDYDSNGVHLMMGTVTWRVSC